MFIKYCNVITLVLYYQIKLTCFINVWWLCSSCFLNNITLYYVRAVISVVPDLQKIGKMYTPNGKASLSQHKDPAKCKKITPVYKIKVPEKCFLHTVSSTIVMISDFFSFFKTIVPAFTLCLVLLQHYHFLIRLINIQGETILISPKRSLKKRKSLKVLC